jgi:DivIVA domain-containing protein
MSDPATPPRPDRDDEPNPFEELISAAGQNPVDPSFATVFRGYDKDEVDAAISALTARVRTESEQVAHLTDRQRRLGALSARNRQSVERLEAELAAARSEAEASADGIAGGHPQPAQVRGGAAGRRRAGRCAAAQRHRSG